VSPPASEVPASEVPVPILAEKAAKATRKIMKTPKTQAFSIRRTEVRRRVRKEM